MSSSSEVVAQRRSEDERAAKRSGAAQPSVSSEVVAQRRSEDERAAKRSGAAQPSVSSETRIHPSGIIRPLRSTTAAPSRVSVAALDDELVLPVSVETVQLEAAWSDGFQSGVDEGMARGLAIAAAAAAADDRRAAGLRQAIEDAAHHVAAMTVAKLEDCRDLLLDAAFELAQAIIGAELAMRTGLGEDALRRALELVPDRSAPVARMNPADVDELGDIGELVQRTGVVVQADRNVACGDCILEMPTTRVEICLQAAIERARDVLFADRSTSTSTSASALPALPVDPR